MTAPDKIICSNCGYATNEDVGEDGVTTKVGKCCENLPRPYEYDGNTGTYSAPVGGTRAGRAIEILRENDTVGNGHVEDDCNCPDCVDEALNLSSISYDRISALYDAEDPAYINEIRALGW